ncbi:hypothetical protein CNR22_03110 [Sphingobacteriaceae bacterium]|nr:hypothetical protein CNR22_03110 [Sphingobacteriaceae bacterium]
MRLNIISTFILLFSQVSFFAQTSASDSSRITHSNASDTVAFQLEMKGASYDVNKNKLPYYVVSKTTPYNQRAIATLVVKKTRLVEESHVAVIKKYFSQFITNQFTLEKASSLSKNQNFNHHKIFPFRLNALNQLEELIDYEVNWQTEATNNSASRSASAFAATSVLSTGNWYKIGVTQTGVHRITRSFLNTIGINLASLNPSNIKVYGNGGKMIPELNKAFRYDDLVENPIKVFLTPDGTFDYALFYATGTTEWVKSKSNAGLKFSAKKSYYSDTSFYFITVDQGAGKRITSNNSLSQPADVNSASYDFYNFHENNIINFGKSGREFYGEYFDLTTSYNFALADGFADFLLDTIIAETILVAINTDSSGFDLAGNGLKYHLQTPGIPISTYADFAAPAQRTVKGINTNSSDINFTVSKKTQKSLGWFDKLTVNARRSLIVNSRQFGFRDTRVIGAGKICNFFIQNNTGLNLAIWNVTDPLNPVEQNYNTSGNQIDFKCRVDSVIEFCAVPSSDFYAPNFVGKVVNQNLHAISNANYLIITHPLFIKEAERMGAFHQQKEGLTYAIATTDQIYNEFGSGKQDVAAIRDFIRMIYNRTITLPESQQLKYVLLMGDGSYVNKNRNTVNNSNFIPTYESQESLDPIYSIVTDDFYGLMDPDEGFKAEDDSFAGVDIGVGRFPCRTVNEVKAVIAKIENYYKKDANYTANNSAAETSIVLNESPMGDWRTWLLFLGDDEDAAAHMIQSDGLTQVVRSVAPNYNTDDILLDAYQRFSTPGGFRYPDAASDFLKRMKKGAFIFNYTGHGGEVGLTAERLIDLDIINNLDNFNKLPLFITATCEFSRFDDPGRTSAGELCLLNPKGGAIALYTTCRVAFSTKNEQINQEILKRLFTRLPNGKWPTLGDAIALTKATVGQNFFFANFHLLGDPALVLAYPEDKVITSEINNVPVNSGSSDTLGSLSKITIKGYVADNVGNKLTNFNGLVYPTVFDKEQTIICLMNTPTSGVVLNPGATNSVIVPFEFKLQKNILYRGKSQAVNGEFSFTFLVPKDISFSPGPGKISYYATNGLVDAQGYYDQLVVGGTSSKNVVIDNEGPQVNLFLNDKNFVNGGITNEKPVLFADLADSSGINTVGTGIGHDISVILDENSAKPIVLNDYYEANLNSYQSGRVRYPYSDLADGNHTLTFKVWDIQNNSSTVTSDFIVAKSAELALQHVLNYPNPFTTRTKFMFQHNQACNPLKVTVQIYTVTGKIVKTIQKSTSCEGSAPEGIDWDGRDDYGDKLARGVYIYKLAILDVDNKKAEKIEKLVILN